MSVLSDSTALPIIRLFYTNYASRSFPLELHCVCRIFAGVQKVLQVLMGELTLVPNYFSD